MPPVIEDADLTRKQHAQLIRDGLWDANEAILNENDYEAAKTILLKTVANANRLVVHDEIVAPTPNVRESIKDLWADLLSTQGVEFTGLTQQVIPELDDATDGFQGLSLITASSGMGKTMFVSQCALEMLTRHTKSCCLIVSEDMTTKKMMRRLTANRSRMKISAIRKGSTKAGWTDEEKIRVFEAVGQLDDIGDRLRILDRKVFSPTTENIRNEITRLLEETGAEFCTLIIDYLELLPVPKELQADKADDWIIEQMRALADWLEDLGCILCITESNKYETGERGSATRVKGSYRKVMRSDVVITLNPWTDDEILENYELNVHSKYLCKRPEPVDFTGKEKDGKKLSDKIRRALEKRGMAPVMLKIDKARDDATKTEIYLMSHFKQNYFIPWSQSECPN